MKDVDGRDKPGHDDGESIAAIDSVMQSVRDVAMRVPRFLAVVLLVALLSGCAGIDVTCRGEHKRTAELLFGRNIAGRAGVSEAEFSSFVTREITRRFPDGLTIIDARGQWRDRLRNRTVREPSKVVTIVLPGNSADDERLSQIIEVYKARFKQQSVGLIVRPACVSF